jgi:crotonobetainyl-CoA:carnitine CoA-transferase CaiB-like acyl-CoA transferase
MPGPLDGVKVLDLSVMISGPLAAMLLADQGAQVVKIESPGLGDLMRYLGSSRGGMTGIFANCNRGKRSLVLDLKQPQGVEVLKKLAEGADVVIQNFRPGAVDRLGIGYEALAAVNPSLIYVSISGFGPDGPYSGRRVYDNVIQAYAGFAGVQTDPATGTPAALRNLVCDKVTAYTAAQAITAALYARATGKASGQHIELAMLDAGVAFLWPDAAMDIALLEADAHRAPTIGQNYAVTPMADGFTVAAGVSDVEFAAVCQSLGAPELADDPRFARLADRMRNTTELIPLMRSAARQTTVAEFVRRADESGAPGAPVLRLDEVPHDAQVRHNEVFVERHHPVAGTMREPRPAPRFSVTPAGLGIPAAVMGEHSDDVVWEAGFDPDELRAAKIIA